MITYNTDGVKMPKIRKRETTAWIKAVAASYGRKTGEVGYMFVDDEKILEVNREYLGHDYYTDIITFDYDEGDTINGDLVISLDTVRSNAEMLGKDDGKKTARRLDLEKGLLNWLKQRSLAQIFDWFDCLEETTVKTGAGGRRWTTESVARDKLFLELLGVAKS